MKHFEPGQPVIYRHRSDSSWNYHIYNRPYNNRDNVHILIDHTQITDENILSFNDKTKHLIGTYNNYSEYEPEPNTVIAVRDVKKDDWVYRLFLHMDNEGRYVCKVDNSTMECAWQYATSIEESLKDK